MQSTSKQIPQWSLLLLKQWEREQKRGEVGKENKTETQTVRQKYWCSNLTEKGRRGANKGMREHTEFVFRDIGINQKQKDEKKPEKMQHTEIT